MPRRFLRDLSSGVCPYGWVILALLTIMATVTIANTQIFLRQTNSTAWNGLANPVCPEDSPCYLEPNATANLNHTADIIFLDDTYSSYMWNFECTEASFTFLGDIRGLQLSINASSLTFSSTASTFLNSTLNVSAKQILEPITIQTNLSHVNLTIDGNFSILDCVFLDSDITLYSELGISINRLEMNTSFLRASSASTPQTDSPYLTVNSSTLSSSSTEFSYFHNVTLFGSSLTDFELLRFYLIRGTVTIENSTIEFSDSGSQPMPVGASRATLRLLHSRIYSLASTPSSMNIYRMIASDCTFQNFSLRVTAEKEVRLTNVNITQQGVDKSVAFLSPVMSTHDVTFSNEAKDDNTFFAIETPTRHVASSGLFRISDLAIIAPLIVDVETLELTRTLAQVWRLAEHPLPTLRATSTSSWKFHSIDISDVALDFSALTTPLVYVPSAPCKGITSNVPLSSLRNLSIEWPRANFTPITKTAYPVAPFNSSETLPQLARHPQYDLSATFESSSPPSDPNTLIFHLGLSGPFADCNEPNHGPICNPPPGFRCNGDGALYSSAPISVPPGSGTIYLPGNVVVNTSIIIVGFGSQLVVNGCIAIEGTGTGVVLDLEHETSIPDKGSAILVTQSPECGALTVPLTVKTPKQQGCKKAVVKADPKAPQNALVALFDVSNSACNVKWIALGVSLGAVLLIVILVALIFSLNDKARACIRPFTRRRAAKVGDLP